MKSVLFNRIGEVHGLLTVVASCESLKIGNVVRSQWLCQCACGNQIVVRSTNLQSGNSHSCGCLRHTVPLRHGHAKEKYRTPTYNSWSSMIQRCTNPKEINRYKYYGGCGIVICDRWLKFENFLADMGERPAGKTLDRYPNPYGNYEPENCRWATYKEQRHNQRVL